MDVQALLIALIETLGMTIIGTILAYIIGFPLGVLLNITSKNGIKPNRYVNTTFPIHFLSKCTRARFKIGRYAYEGDPFDMIFHGGAREELRGDVCRIFEGLTEFLEKIK